MSNNGLCWFCKEVEVYLDGLCKPHWLWKNGHAIGDIEPPPKHVSGEPPISIDKIKRRDRR